MNVWVIKDTKFGYRYTTNKSIRKMILDYFNEYLYNLLSTKSNKDDILIIAGGLFSNTNPSVVAITDAINCLTKISNIINIVLISNENDLRTFDGENYSTLNIFKNTPKIYPLNDKIITYNNSIIDVNNGVIKIDDKIIPIPIAIKFEKDDNKSGIYINREDGKYTIITNKFSPKHVTYEINNVEDFDNIEINNNDNIHLIINSKLLSEYKSLININIFKYKPTSVKYTDDEQLLADVENIEINNNFNIINTIDNDIEDIKVREQFNRILNIYKNTTKLT